MSRITRGNTDDLVQESEDLREELIKMASRVEAFSDQLQEAISRRQDAEEGADHAQRNTATDE